MSRRPFNTGEPIAFFITWTCYGTWLPGDERGWYQWGEAELRPPDGLVKEAAVAKMKEPALRLSEDDRLVVEATVVEHCRIRGWTLHAVNARSNHVHVVVTAPSTAPNTVRDQLKAWCTRKLKPFHQGRTRFWTEGASCRSINQEEDLSTAIEYTRDAQDRKGREYKHEAPASE